MITLRYHMISYIIHIIYYPMKIIIMIRCGMRWYNRGTAWRTSWAAAPSARPYTILGCTILYILCYTMLYYAILCYTILYYTILYYTILYYSIRGGGALLTARWLARGAGGHAARGRSAVLKASL